MAREFIYDNVGFSKATVEDGTVSGTTFNPTPDSVTNEERANDMSISTTFTSFGLNDALRFDVGSDNSSTNVNVIAFYLTSGNSNDIKLYASSSPTNIGSQIAEQNETFIQGWNILTFSNNAGRYWYVLSSTGTIDDISEILLGTRYEFPINPELNAQIGEEYGTDVVTSYGGNEYGNKRHEPQTTWSFNFSHMLSSQKTALEALNSNMQNWKKFIYKDDSSYHYVRLTKPIGFTEVAPSVFSANINLREQIG